MDKTRPWIRHATILYGIISYKPDSAIMEELGISAAQYLEDIHSLEMYNSLNLFPMRKSSAKKQLVHRNTPAISDSQFREIVEIYRSKLTDAFNGALVKYTGGMPSAKTLSMLAFEKFLTSGKTIAESFFSVLSQAKQTLNIDSKNIDEFMKREVVPAVNAFFYAINEDSVQQLFTQLNVLKNNPDQFYETAMTLLQQKQDAWFGVSLNRVFDVLTHTKQTPAQARKCPNPKCKYTVDDPNLKYCPECGAEL